MNQWKQYQKKYSKSWGKSQSVSKKISEWLGKKRGRSFDAPGKPPRRPLSAVVFYIITLLIALSFAGAVAVAVIFVLVGKDLPDPSSLNYRMVPQSTKIYDRTGEIVLYDIHGEEKRTIIDFDDIPELVKKATLAAEDRQFYEHKGINWKGIFRAAIIDVLEGKKAQGGSSITQQLVKNSILSREKTFTRKIKELVLAYRLESRFSKDEILGMYFNEIPYGSTIYGIEAAAGSFFGKSTKDLNLTEIALLTALPKAPSYYSPYGNHREELLARTFYVLDELAKDGAISQKELEDAKNYKILENILPYREQILAPHFVMYIKDLLTEKYGEKMVEQGGLKIITTLDMDKQKIAEESVDKYIEQNEKEFNATNAAMVAINPKTGQILAMVGSRDFFEPTFGSVNVVLRPRQPGSSFKPVMYAAAFQKGYTPSTILYDVPTKFKTLIEGEYEPKNYNEKTHGPVTVKTALAGSLNIPAVKMLYLTGIDRVLDLAEKMGYTTLNDRSRFGLSLVLGGGEVKLLEHTDAFGVFINDGNFVPTAAILRVEDSRGNILEEWQQSAAKVLDEEICRNIIDILSDNEARAFIFGTNNYLVLGSRPAAVKTGTTNEFHDAWTIGGTPSLVAGVWAGNNDNKEMKEKADGSRIAAPIWNNFMAEALKNTIVEEFKKPAPIVTGKPILDGQTSLEYGVQIDRASGKLATQYTPKSFIETKTYKQVHSILYYIGKDDPRGPAPEHPETDEQFNNWEEAALSWALANNIIASAPPTEYDNLHIPANFPALEVLNISNGIAVGRNFEVQTRASAPRGIRRVEISFDNRLWINSPYSGSLPVSVPTDFTLGPHTMKISVFDDIDNSATKEFTINLSF